MAMVAIFYGAFVNIEPFVCECFFGWGSIGLQCINPFLSVPGRGQIVLRISSFLLKQLKVGRRNWTLRFLGCVAGFVSWRSGCTGGLTGIHFGDGVRPHHWLSMGFDSR